MTLAHVLTYPLLVFHGPGWERHASGRGGALFLHNPATGESRWFTGWVERKSRWYGRSYWFQPTTGRAEWELPDSADGPEGAVAAASGQSPFVQSSVVPTPSSDQIQSWKQKILAAKAKTNAGAGGGSSPPPPPPPAPVREGGGRDDDAASSGDDMEVDAEIAGGVQLLSPSDIAPAADMLLEDVPSVSLRREELRKQCLQRFADANFRIAGKMMGNSKTCRSCREDGMVVGLSGMFGRCVAYLPAGGGCDAALSKHGTVLEPNARLYLPGDGELWSPEYLGHFLRLRAL